jgi:cytochrome bd ubiquinol oxidase subunit II
MEVTVIWAVIIALGLFMYVALDGFDLGIGIVFPFFSDETHRDTLMNAIAPVWDGNETWLVLGGAALFAAFPLVYSAALSALYLPIIFMLVCLIFRGVSFEVRAKANRTKGLWNLAFALGSAGATFFQGVILGAYLQGIPIQNGVFSGDSFFWFSAFSVFTGMGLLSTYALLGVGFLLIKTEGELQSSLRGLVRPLTVVLLGFIVAVTIWTPAANLEIGSRWLDPIILGRLYVVPALVSLCAVAIFMSVKRRYAAVPFVASLCLVLLGYIGLVVSIWPYAIPGSVTFWEAAAPRSSQIFTLVGAVIIIPIIVGYTTCGYWVFRGKVQSESKFY